MILTIFRTWIPQLVAVGATLLTLASFGTARAEDVPEIKPERKLTLKEGVHGQLGAFTEGSKLLISTFKEDDAPKVKGQRQFKATVALWDLEKERFDFETAPDEIGVHHTFGSNTFTTIRTAFNKQTRAHTSTVTVFESLTGKKVREFEAAGRIDPLHGPVAVSPTGSVLASSGMDAKEGVVYNMARGDVIPYRLRSWNTEKGKPVLDLNVRAGNLFFSSDTKYAVLSHQEDTSLLDAASGRRLATITARDAKGALGLGDWSFSADSKRIAGCLTGRIKHGVMSIDSPITPLTPGIPTTSSVPDAKLPQILLWDVKASKEVARFGEGELVSTVKFSPAGTLLAAATLNAAGGQDIVLWDTEKRKKVARLLVAEKDPERKQALMGAVFSFAFTGDGKKLAAMPDDHSLILWDLSSVMEKSAATEK